MSVGVLVGLIVGVCVGVEVEVWVGVMVGVCVGTAITPSPQMQALASAGPQIAPSDVSKASQTSLVSPDPPDAPASISKMQVANTPSGRTSAEVHKNPKRRMLHVLAPAQFASVVQAGLPFEQTFPR